MTSEEMKAAFGEVLTERDADIKAELIESVGVVAAEKAAEVVKAARVQDMIAGRSSLGTEEKQAFVDDIKAISMPNLGQKAAYLTVNDQTGGYLVPIEVHNEIMRIGETTGHVLRDARNFGMTDIEIPTYTGDAMQGSYVGEDQAGTEDQKDLGVAKLKGADWMNIIRISNKMIKKANVNTAEWLMALVAEGLAYRFDREGFMGGTYAGSPFIGHFAANSNATVQTLNSGNTSFANFTPDDASIAIGSMPTAAVSGGAFYFHRTVWARIRNSKLSNGEYAFKQDNAAIGSLRRENGIQAVGEIHGYPVYTSDVLPAFSADGVSTKFGMFANLTQSLAFGQAGPMETLRSENATVNGVSVFERNQTAMRFTDEHSIVEMLPEAAVVFKTAAS